MKQELAVLTTSDLNAAGINSQLSSNDLVEVVAHDIYNKIIETISANTERYKELSEKYDCLFDKELDAMKKELLSAGYLDEDELKRVSENIYPENSRYWATTQNLRYIGLTEKDKGTKVDSNYKSLGYVKGGKGKVRLVIEMSGESEKDDIALKGITGYVNTTVSKSFAKAINTSSAKWSSLFKEVDAHNKEVDSILKALPQAGLLSVERFTREARVKMNKKIISAQSPDFRKKISELFNIKL